MADGGGLVLMYHHIDEGWSDPGTLKVSPQHFAEQLEVLRREAHPLHLEQLAEAVRAGQLPSRSVVVTFDDGYLDNLVNAKPLLERYEVPATVFVAGGPGDEDSEFWWDELERLLLAPGVLPGALELAFDGATLQFELGDAAVYGERACAEHREWRAWDDPPTPRHALYSFLSKRLVSMDDDEQRYLMGQLRDMTSRGVPARATSRRLSASGLDALSREQLVTVGAHTMTHPMLSRLPLDRQREEIERNKSYLEDQLNGPVDSFSYPFGDYSPATEAIVRESKFLSACTTTRDRVQSGSDPFALPRLHVNDLDGEQFARWLRQAWIEI